MKRCYECGKADIRQGTEEAVIEVAGRSFTADVPATKCAACGAVAYSAPHLQGFEGLVAMELARSGARSGDAFRLMRKAISMSAAELAGALDVARETVSRWETGALEVPKLPWLVLSAMVLDVAVGGRATLDRVRAFVSPPEVPARMRLELPPLRAVG